MRKLWIGACALAAAVAAASVYAAPAATPAADCEYVPMSVDASRHPPQGNGDYNELLAHSIIHEVRAPGCLPQCVARVFCLSDHARDFPGKTIDQISVEEKIGKGVVLNCDAILNVNPSNPQCHFADECMAIARKEPWRKAVDVAPSTQGPATHKQSGSDAELNVLYGFTRPQLPGPRSRFRRFPANREGTRARCAARR